MVGAWGGHSNGNIPTSAMGQVEPGDWSQLDAAAAWAKLVRAVANETGVWINVEEAYRSYAQQQYYWNRYVNRLPGWTVAAVPGTSNHGWGLAYDLAGYEGAWEALNRLAPSYGWSWATGRASGERWHWEYVGAIGAASGGGGGGGTQSFADLGEASIKDLQAQLGVTVDGVAGPETIKATQTRLGVTADGVFGEQSIRALQLFTGAVVDGDWGPATTQSFRSTIGLPTKPFTMPGTTPPPSGSDPDVLAAQLLLNQLGYTVVANGVKGPDTWAAIKDFQSKHGLDADGIAGPVTQAKMKEVIDGTVVVTPGYYRPTGVPVGTLFGIDVSRYQAGFDFAAYKTGAREDFVILKRGGSNAGTYIDSKYAEMLPQARAHFSKIGHYWFNGREGVSSPTESAKAMLKDFDIKPGELVVLDIENEGTIAAYSCAEAMEFGAEIERQLGIKPILYMSASLARQAQWVPAVAAGYKLWVAMYSWLSTSPNAGQYVPNDVDPLGPWGAGDAWVIHQYTSTVYGTMPGTASKSLDRNIAKANVFEDYGYRIPEPEVPEEVDLAMIRSIAELIRSEANKIVTEIDK